MAVGVRTTADALPEYHSDAGLSHGWDRGETKWTDRPTRVCVFRSFSQVSVRS
jgi:hypothetical protein